MSKCFCVCLGILCFTIHLNLCCSPAGVVIGQGLARRDDHGRTILQGDTSSGHERHRRQVAPSSSDQQSQPSKTDIPAMSPPPSAPMPSAKSNENPSTASSQGDQPNIALLGKVLSIRATLNVVMRFLKDLFESGSQALKEQVRKVLSGQQESEENIEFGSDDGSSNPARKETARINVFAMNLYMIPNSKQTKISERSAEMAKLCTNKYDLYFFTELWNKASYDKIRKGCEANGIEMDAFEDANHECDKQPHERKDENGCYGLGIAYNTKKFKRTSSGYKRFDKQEEGKNEVDGHSYAFAWANLTLHGSGLKVNVFVPHFQADNPNGKDCPSIKKTEWYRYQNAGQFARALEADPSDFLIVGGDLNCDPETAEYNRVMRDTDLTDCRKKAHPKETYDTNKTTATWANDKNKLNPESKSCEDKLTKNMCQRKCACVGKCQHIKDYIFYRSSSSGKAKGHTKSFDTLFLRTKDKVDLSDHQGIAATITIE